MVPFATSLLPMLTHPGNTDVVSVAINRSANGQTLSTRRTNYYRVLTRAGAGRRVARRNATLLSVASASNAAIHQDGMVPLVPAGPVPVRAGY